MLNFDPKRFFSIVAASYGKRLLEKPYDQLSQTELFQKLKDQPALAKQAIEAASYVLTALFEQKAVDSSPFWRSVNEVLMDVGPELSKRMLNGDTGPLTINAEKYTTLVEKPAEKIFLQVLLENLDLEKITGLAAWLKGATPEEKFNILKYIRGLAFEKIVEIGQLSTKDAGDLFTAFEKPSGNTTLKKLNEDLRESNRKLRERIATKKGGTNV